MQPRYSFFNKPTKSVLIPLALGLCAIGAGIIIKKQFFSDKADDLTVHGHSHTRVKPKQVSNLQRDAAVKYWTEVLLGNREIPLGATKDTLPLYFLTNQVLQRRKSLEKINEENPDWESQFGKTLKYLITKDSHNGVTLALDFGPKGILKQAADSAGIPANMFPMLKANMQFDGENNLLVNDTVIPASEFVDVSVKSKLRRY